MKVEITGGPGSPKEAVLALEAVCRSITAGRSDGVMALMVCACRVYRDSCDGDPDDIEAVSGVMAQILGAALGCAMEWWPEPGDQALFGVGNDNDRQGGPLQ